MFYFTMHITCPNNFLLLYLITLIIFDKNLGVRYEIFCSLLLIDLQVYSSARYPLDFERPSFTPTKNNK